MSAAHTPHDPPAPPVEPVDSGLRCPKCEYNLTGLVENRCPECGGLFDWDELHGRIDESVRPATPWDTEGGLLGYWRTWWLAIWRPASLARAFPYRFDERAARNYARISYAAACALILAPVVSWGADVALAFVVLCAMAMVGFPMCDAAMASMLNARVPRYAKADHERFWRGMMRYLSGYAILSAASVAASVQCLIKVQAATVVPRIVMGGLGLATCAYLLWIRAVVIVVDVKSSRRGNCMAVIQMAVLSTMLSAVVAGYAVGFGTIFWSMFVVIWRLCTW